MKEEALKLAGELLESPAAVIRVEASNMIRRLVKELDKQENFNKENPVKDVFNSEPVAWIYERPNGSAKLVWVREPHDKSIIKEIPLYRTPQTKPSHDFNTLILDTGEKRSLKPLSDEEIVELIPVEPPIDGAVCGSVEGLLVFARAIEAKVRGEK